MIAILTAIVALGVGIQDEPKPAKLTEAEYPKYMKLRLELGVVRYRAERTRNPKKLARIEAARKKALGESGWSEAEFNRINDEVSGILSLLSSIDSEPESKEAYEEQLKDEHDATTVATVRAKRKELDEFEKGEQEKIQARAKEDELPAVVDVKELPGTWALDIDATVDRLLDGLGDEEMRKKAKDDMTKLIVSSTYVFGSDGTIESTNERPGGAKETEKGTYRLDGRKLFIKREGRKAEIELEVGMEEGQLIMGVGVAQTVCKKQK